MRSGRHCADARLCGDGHGGTLAGLVAGHQALEAGPEIVGVAVSRKDEGYEGRCAALANASLAWLGSDVRVTADDFTVDRGYFEPGYEQPNEAANEAIRLLARTEGLLTDPVYTERHSQVCLTISAREKSVREKPSFSGIPAARRRCSQSRRFWEIWRTSKGRKA